MYFLSIVFTFALILHVSRILKSGLKFVQIDKVKKKPEELTFTEKLLIPFRGLSIPKPTNEWTPKDYELPFQKSILETDRGMIDIWDIPCEQPKAIVLMFHGWASAKYTLIPTAKVLHEHQYQCILVDFQGSGDSGGLETTLGINEAETVEAVYYHISRKHVALPKILYGFSMGGVAVSRAINQFKLTPEMILLECTFSRVTNALRSRISAVLPFHFYLDYLLVALLTVFTGKEFYNLNPSNYLKSSSVPQLIIQGETDPRVSSNEALELHESSNSTNKYIWISPGVGHDFSANYYPLEFMRKLEETRGVSNK